MAEINPFAILDSIGVTGCTGTTRIQGGWDTTLWQVICDGKAFALRLHRPENAAWVDSEVQAMRAARAAGISVPEVHLQGEWNGRPVLLIDWCEGRTLMQAMRRRPWSIRTLGKRLGHRQAELHQVMYNPPGIDRNDWITRFGRIDDELRERLIDVAAADNRLIHLDFHPLNIMVTGREIGCILDWTNAASGDPRADVARTWAILRLMPLTPGRPEPVTESARKLLAAGWLRAYEERAGTLFDMPLFKAWAGATMVIDMQRNVNRPEIWIEQRHVDTIQARVDQLRVEAGLRPVS
jgi:aminoglycoside phosphotransferase (APT) family kinase protein